MPVPKPAPRADFGQPIDDYFAKQPPNLGAILEQIRSIIDEVAPDATSSIKWGQPFYAIGGAMTCAVTAHKAHVNLVLSGPTDAFADPDHRLIGEGKSGRHLKLTQIEDLPVDQVRGWVQTAAELARKAAKN